MDKIERLRRANERDAAKARELARKRQARGQEISQLSRTQDTRRKVLAGSWLLDEIAKDATLRARMTRALDAVWLWRDDDRRLFGFEVLSEEEKARRELAYGKAGRKKTANPEAVASALDGSAAASADAPVRQTEVA